MAIIHSVMKKSIFILFLLIPIFLKAQPWYKEFLVPGWTYHEACSMLEDYDKGYILSLAVWNTSPLNHHNLNYKIDDNGNLIYEIILGAGNTENSLFEFPSLSPQGELVMAGSTLQPSVGENPMIVLLDSCRQKVWCTSLINNLDYPDFFNDAVMLPDKSIVALSSQNDVDMTKAVHLHKFSPDGQPVWRKEIVSRTLHPQIWNPWVYKLLLLSDGGYLVTGECYWPNPGDPPNGGWIRMFIVKADAEGNEVWFYVHGVDDYVYSFGRTSQEYNGAIYTDGATFDVQTGVYYPHIFKISSNGNPLFDTEIAVEYNNRVTRNKCLISKNYNGYFFTTLNMYPFDLNSYDSSPAMAKIDTMGVVHDFFMFDTVPPRKYIGLPVITRDNKIITPGAKATGSSYITDVFASRFSINPITFDTINWSAFSYDSLCPEIESHTVSLDNCLIVVKNNDYQPPVRHFGMKMTPIPTPASNNLKIVYDNTLLYRNITIRFFNSFGYEMTYFEVNSGINESKINIENWPEGLYIAVAYSGNNKIGSCKILVIR